MKLEHIWPPNPLKSADFSDEIGTHLTHKALKSNDLLMKLKQIWPRKPLEKYWFVDEIGTNLTSKTPWKVTIFSENAI